MPEVVDAKKEAEERMTKRRGDQAVRDHTSGKERAMARRSKPGGVTPAEHKAFRDTAVGKAMGRVFRPKKAREADAEAGPGFAAPEDVHPVWDTGATGAVEEAVAAAPTASAAPEKPPGMIFYDDTATDGTIRYQPKGDPFQYRLLPDGTFQVTDPKTGAVKASAAKGSDTYQAFQDHYDAAMGVGDWKWKASGDAPADAAADAPADAAAPDAPDAPAMPADVPAAAAAPAPAAPDAAAGVVPLGDMPRSDEGSIPIGEMSPSEGPVNLPRVTAEAEEALELEPEPAPAPAAERPASTTGGELTEEAVTTGPHRLVSPDGTVINKRVAAQIARGELDPDAWDKLHEELKESGRIKWTMGPSVEDLLADEGFVRTARRTPTWLERQLATSTRPRPGGEGRGPTHQVGVRQFPPTPSEMRQIRERAARVGFEPTRTPAKYENTLRIPD